MTKEEQKIILAQAIAHCGSESRSKIANWFFTQVGIIEEPVNKILYNDWFYSKPISGKPYAWCATFCCYGMDKCGFPYPKMGWNHGFCSVPDYHKRMIKANRLTPDPKLMDDIIFDWEDDGADDHIAKFVCWVDATRKEFYTIEGNTSFDEKGNQSRGGAVAFRRRKISSVSAFIALDYLIK